jgi:hypothetical protein
MTDLDAFDCPALRAPAGGFCMSDDTEREDKHLRGLTAAMDRYSEQFGAAPPVFGFMGDVPRLAAEIIAACERRRVLTRQDLFRRLGTKPPSLETGL